MLPSPTSEEGILGQELRDALEWSTFVVCILCNHFVLVRSIFWDWRSLCLVLVRRDCTQNGELEGLNV